MNVIQNKTKKTSEQRRFNDNDFMSTENAIKNTINLFGASSRRQRKTTSNECIDDNEANEMSTTRATMASSSTRPSTMYVAITSGRGYAQAEVGLAFIDVESPSINLNQLSDDLWFTGLITKLNILQPEKVLVPNTLYDAAAESMDGKLLKYIREQFPYLNIIRVPRRHFNDKDGLELIQKFCSEKHKDIKELITTKYYALSAVSGLLKYLEYSMNLCFVKNSLKLDFNAKYGHMLIDVDTTQKLELLGPAVSSSTKGNHASLYDFLNNCVTRIGKRSLRAKILEPSCDTADIHSIHECIAELNRCEFFELNVQLSNVLKNFYSVDRLHKLAIVLFRDDSIRAAETLINQTLQLKRCLESIPFLRERLEPLTSKVFQDIFRCLGDVRFQQMLEHIEKVVNKEILNCSIDSGGQLQLHQRISCIQNGYSSIVDMSRNAYIELTAEIREQTAALSTKCGQAFRLNYTAARGFHLQLMVSVNTSTADFPEELEVLELKRNTCYLTTSDITKLNIRLKSVMEEIIVQSNIVLVSMLSEIAKDMDIIYDLTGFIGTLDVLLSFSKISACDGFVRPTFANEIRLVDGVHPLLERNVERTLAVPNNVIATPDYNFFLITGPNMSGKTVYIKMIAVLQVMAQLGCYVPAASAQFRVTDRIFSRLGSSESIEKKSSSFVAEIKSIEHILKNVTPNSLVVVDELCQTTNPREGAQLAWELCEQLVCLRGVATSGHYFVNEETIESTPNLNKSFTTRSSSVKDAKLDEISAPFIFLTTHYHSLTKLTNSYFNAVNLCLNAEEIEINDERHLKQNHSIQEGVTNNQSYGLALAKTVRLPLDIVPQAEIIYREIKNSEDGTEINHNVHSLRHCSKFSKALCTQFTGMEINGLNNGSTAASFVSRSKHSRESRNRFSDVFSRNAFLSGTTTTTVLSTETETECLKIDKVLYNLYADISSAVRCKDMEYKDIENRDAEKEQETIKTTNECLHQFTNLQPRELLQALLRVNENFADNQTVSSSYQTNLPRAPEIQRNQNPSENHPANNTFVIQSNRMHTERSRETSSNKKDNTNLSQLSYQSIQRRYGSQIPEPMTQFQLSNQEIETRDENFLENTQGNLSGNKQRWSPPPQTQALFEEEFDNSQMFTPNLPSTLRHQDYQLENVNAPDDIFDKNISQNIQKTPSWGLNVDIRNPTQLSFDEYEWQNKTRQSNIPATDFQMDWHDQDVAMKPVEKLPAAEPPSSSAIGRISLIPSKKTISKQSPFHLGGGSGASSTSTSPRNSMTVNPSLTMNKNLAMPSCSYKSIDQNFTRPKPMPAPKGVPTEGARKSLGLRRPIPIITKYKKTENNKILHSEWLTEYAHKAQQKSCTRKNMIETEPIASRAKIVSEAIESEPIGLTKNVQFVSISAPSNLDRSVARNVLNIGQKQSGGNAEKETRSSKDSGFVRTHTQQPITRMANITPQQPIVRMANIPPLPTPKPDAVLEFSDIVLPPPMDFD